jgi:hypothetical protein
MTRECHVRFCEHLGGQFPGVTRQFPVATRRRPCCRLSQFTQHGTDFVDDHLFVVLKHI